VAEEAVAALVAVCRKLRFHSRILTVVAEVADIPQWPWDLIALLLTKGHIRVGVVGVTAGTAAAAQATAAATAEAQAAADTSVAVEVEVSVVAEANTEVPNARHGRQHRRRRSSRRHRTKKRNNSKGNNFLKRKK
jgi:hypothetical protein